MASIIKALFTKRRVIDFARFAGQLCLQ